MVDTNIVVILLLDLSDDIVTCEGSVGRENEKTEFVTTVEHVATSHGNGD